MFTDQERRIFSFHDGEKQRFADPMAFHRQLFAVVKGERLDELLAEYFGAAEEEGKPPPTVEAVAASQAAWVALVEVGYKAFGLSRIDMNSGKGTTDEEAFNVLYSFLLFRQKKASPEENSPTCSPLPVSLPSADSSSPTINTSPSGVAAITL